MQPIVGMRYTWEQVTTLWHGEQTFLAKRDGRIVCATLVKAENPEAPEVMVVGTKPRNIQRAEEFCQQGGAIPVFLKHAVNEWEFAGHFELASSTTTPDTLRRHAGRPGETLTRVIYLRRVDDAASVPVTDAELEELPIKAEEGRQQWRRHLIRERRRSLVSRKKADAKRRTGRLACEVCDFEFGRGYGPELEGFCEVHHLMPLASDEHSGETDLSDLAILCANCHRAIHRLGPAMPTIGELRAIVGQRARV